MIEEKKGHILCVDDEPALLRSLQWLLERDFEVRVALGGEEGLRELGENDFDVIISDQRMPGMTGAEFLCQAREIAPRAMRILLTGYTDMEALLSSVNEGEIWRFIKKPWNRDELSRLVETAAQIARESGSSEFDAPLESAGDSKVLVISDDANIQRTFKDRPIENVQVIHTDNLSEAVQVVSNERIGTVVSEVKIGSTDVTRFIALLKQKQPDVVSVVVAEETDLKQLVKLINHGQVYRYTKKPVQDSYLMHLVVGAMTKHTQLAADPAMRARHTAAESGEDLEQALMQELALAEADAPKGEEHREAPGASHETKDGMGKFRQSLKKLFGR